MRILRIRVPSFGPLRGLEMEPSPGLTVVWGPNEAGKTTLFDFLVSQLFRWEQKTGTRLETVLPGVDRFGSAAEAGGRVEVRLGDEVLSYPGSTSLLHRLELEHASLAGLFCVRSGELELPGAARGEFWPELKKLLSGLPRGVDTLREAVHRQAHLTPGGEPSDRGDPGPRTRHRELEERIERLEVLETRLEPAARFEADVARVEARLEAMERARKALIATLFEDRQRLASELADLPELPIEALREWRSLRHEREGELSRRLERARTGVDEASAEAAGRAERRRDAEREAEELRARLDAAREVGLERRAAELTTEPPRLEREPSALSSWIYKAAFGLVLVLLALALLLPGHLLTAIAFPLLIAFAAVTVPVLVWRHRRRKGEEARRKRAERARKLRQDAASAGLEVESASEVAERLRRLEVEAARRESELEAAAASAEEAEGRAARAREELEAAERRVREIERRTAELAERLEVEGIDEAETRARTREECASRLRDVERSLEALAGSDPARWDVPAPEDAEALPAWDPQEKVRLERRAATLRSEYRELRDAFVQAGLSTPEDVLTELRSARSAAQRLELDWEAGRLAGEVFATMDEVLERRLSEALDSRGPLSPGALLHSVTGRYRGLVRDERGALELVDEEGLRLPIDLVSRGTRDQVLLALRAGLARAALRAAGLEEPGLLLLDDAFLTADWSRRERLVETVAGLAGEGWQVIYLTCDDHLRDLFTGAGARLEEL